MVRKNILSEADQALVREATKIAEAGTSGEIVTLITKQSDHYTSTKWAIAFLAALAALLLRHYLNPVFDFGMYLETMLAGSIAGGLFSEISGVAVSLTPRHYRKKAVANFAKEHFFDLGLHATGHRAVILIVISLREHCVEIIADTGIAKKAPVDAWTNLAVKISVGMRANSPGVVLSEAIKDCAIYLKTYFPSSDINANVFSDDVISI